MRYPTETRRFVTRDGAALNREPPRNLPRPRKRYRIHPFTNL